jgi:uncharacterized membrane protein YfcA
MLERMLFLIAAVFLLAGFVKGVLGLGLPTVSMGLLAVTMQPSRALAIVIAPAIITNIWQTFGGPYLRDILRRLWPLMLCTVIMQAIGMEKDELVQALGVFFTVATLALSVNVSASGMLNATTAIPGTIALACSFAGMFFGQSVRAKMPTDAFRRWFLIGMILLGFYLAGSAIYELGEH